MVNLLEPILAEIKPEYIMIFVGVMVVCAILALIKKAIKVLVIVIVIALGIGALAPMAKDFQEKYKFGISDGVAQLTVQGETFDFDYRMVDNVELENKNGKEYTLGIYFNDGSNMGIRIPNFMRQSIIDYCNKYNVEYNVKD